MDNTIWKVNSFPYLNENYNNSSNIDPIIFDILKNKKITSNYDIDKFLNPDFSKLGDSFLLSDMNIACNRIFKAIENNEKICIYGDYDVDGITSVSLLVMGFRKIGVDVSYYIPIRDEGYGLNNDALKSLSDDGINLVITVDCGISSINEIDYANSIGLDVIITDHHEINNDLPNAVAVINPKRVDNKYKFTELAGVGVSFMLLHSLYKLKNMGDEVLEFIDIACIGSVADIVRLVEDNRIFVKLGLEVIKNTKNLGLKVFLNELFKEKPDTIIDSYAIGFRIAPCFNASGRLDDAKKSVKLLTSTDKIEAKHISLELISDNNERKTIQNDILKKVEDQIVREKLSENPVIIAYDKGFHHGVIGIVASKIVDKYYKPAIILEIKEDEGIAVASCRSIETFNIVNALNKLKDLLIKYGGHDAAAGFSISISNLDEFKRRIFEYANETMTVSDYIRRIKIDNEIIMEKISYDFCKTISLLEPFGFGNYEPVFFMNNIPISFKKLVGADKTHLMIKISIDNKDIQCMGFSKGHLYDKIDIFQSYNIAFKLKNEEYLDKYYTKMYIEDIHPPTIKNNYNIYYYYLKNTIFPIESIAYTKQELPLNKTYNIKLNSDNSAEIVFSTKTYGYLNNETAYFLHKLNENYNYQFQAKVKNIITKDKHFIIELSINRLTELQIFSTKDSIIFNEIKNFLLPDFNYNSLQKNILKEVYHKKNNILINYNENRGINTALLTLAMFYYIKTGEKSEFISKEKILNKEIYSNYFDFHSEFKNYKSPFYVIYGDFEKDVLDNIKNPVVIINSNETLPNFTKLDDDISIPKNINIINLEEFYNKKLENSNIYSKNIPTKDKLQILSNIEKDKIIATNDIKILL